MTDAPAKPVRRRRPGRLLAVGGYLAFGSLLLMVILAGIRLFEEKDVFTGVVEQTGIARDSDVILLGRTTGFRSVEGGDVAWGAHLAPRGPVTEAIIDNSFELGMHEVTNDQFYEFLLALAERALEETPEVERDDKWVPVPGHYYPPQWSRNTGQLKVKRMYARGDGNRPVTSVAFATALEFCAWFWEEKLARNPDLIVDLPTADEYVRAARGDNVDANFPWGERLEHDKVNLQGELEGVTTIGPFHGFTHLVGNAAEWVYGLDPEQTPNAAGWSIESSYHYARWENPKSATRQSPFEKSQLEPVDRGPARPHVGFRIVLRHAHAVPRFVRVAAGPVRHRQHAESDRPLLLPPRLGMDGPRRPRVSFPAAQDNVERSFEMAQSEITNRQYLAFLVEKIKDGENLLWLLPDSFTRPHPFGDWDLFEVMYGDPAEVDDVAFSELRPTSPFVGPYGWPQWIPFIYPAGTDNRPVAGVTVDQAEEYAEWLSRKLGAGATRCRLPTVAEFLRAGREDRVTPYSWGDDPLRPELVCSGRRDDENRAVSLAGRYGTAGGVIHGLAGNLPEIVEVGPKRFLLAGGFFKLPAEHCTLDTFFDVVWDYVEIATEDGKLAKFEIGRFVGFRVVRIGF